MAHLHQLPQPQHWPPGSTSPYGGSRTHFQNGDDCFCVLSQSHTMTEVFWLELLWNDPYGHFSWGRDIQILLCTNIRRILVSYSDPLSYENSKRHRSSFLLYNCFWYIAEFSEFRRNYKHLTISPKARSSNCLSSDACSQFQLPRLRNRCICICNILQADA